MTDKDKIRAEIERQINLNNNIDPITTSQELVVDSVNVVLTDLLDYISSLPEEPVNEDLEKAAKEYAVKEAAKDINGNWTTTDILNDFKAGAQWQKERIMANSTNATICLPYENKDGGYTHLVDVSRPLPVGDNKIAIIFKEK